jgi:hypothetical protein
LPDGQGGTAKGLQRFVQTATGEANFEIKESVDSDGPSKLFDLELRPRRSGHINN